MDSLKEASYYLPKRSLEIKGHELFLQANGVKEQIMCINFKNLSDNQL